MRRCFICAVTILAAVDCFGLDVNEIKRKVEVLNQIEDCGSGVLLLQQAIVEAPMDVELRYMLARQHLLFEEFRVKVSVDTSMTDIKTEKGSYRVVTGVKTSEKRVPIHVDKSIAQLKIMANLGEGGLDKLIEMAADEDFAPVVRQAGMDLLAEKKYEKSIPMLLEQMRLGLTSKDVKQLAISAHAALIIIRLGAAQQAKEIALEAIRNLDPASEARSYFQKPSAAFYAQCALILGKARAEEAREFLVQGAVAQFRPASLETAFRNALRTLGLKPSVDMLAAIYRDENRQEQARLNALGLLAEIKDPDAEVEKVLLEALKDPTGNAKWIAAKRLGELKSKAAVPALIELLKDKDWTGIQKRVIEVLGQIGDKRAIDPLFALLDEPRRSGYYDEGTVYTALAKIGDKRSLDRLLTRLESLDLRGGYSRGVEPLLDAIGPLGDQKAATRIIKWLGKNYSVISAYSYGSGELTGSKAIDVIKKLGGEEEAIKFFSKRLEIDIDDVFRVKTAWILAELNGSPEAMKILREYAETANAAGKSEQARRAYAAQYQAANLAKQALESIKRRRQLKEKRR